MAHSLTADKHPATNSPIPKTPFRTGVQIAVTSSKLVVGMKTVYIIPGFDETNDSAGYRPTAEVFRTKGFHPTIVDIGWKRRTVTSYLQLFLSRFRQSTGPPDCLFGFSMGAMVALAAAAILKPDTLLLCSLSPYFKEDLSHLTEDDNATLGVRRIKDFTNYSFPSLAAGITSRTVIFTGSLELKTLMRRSEIAGHEIRGAGVHIVRGAGHALEHPAYQQAITHALEMR